MIRISILSPASKIREKIFSNVQAAVQNLAINVVIIHHDNQSHPDSYTRDKAITAPPVIIVNGEMKSSGRIPDIDEITTWLEAKRVRIG